MTEHTETAAPPSGERASPCDGASPSAAPRHHEPWPIHPFLFALYPPVTAFANNVREVYLSSLWLPLAISLGGALALFLALKAARVATLKAAFITTIVCNVIWMYGYLAKAVEASLGATLAEPPALIAATLGLATILAIWLLRTRIPLGKPTSLLNGIAALLLAMATGLAALGARNADEIDYGMDLSEAHVTERGRPDIYWIVMDAYGRADTLRRVTGLDNGPFLQRMRERGFFVADRSVSNYWVTMLAVPSPLQGVYLDPTIAAAQERVVHLDVFRRGIEQSPVFAGLRRFGYEIATFSTGFEITELRNADHYFGPQFERDSFHQFLYQSTLFGAVSNLFPSEKNSYRNHRRRVLYFFETLPRIAEIEAPTFTFAHVVVPHPPFIFGPNGEDVATYDQPFTYDDSGEANADYGPRYAAQATYVNKLLEEAIDEILARSPQPPIIIIQGDHGSREGSHWDVARDDLPEMFSILNLYYFPDGRPAELRADISPVNTFRVLFNATFGTRLPLLDTRCVWTHIVTLAPTDVTNVVLAARPAAAAAE